MRTYTFLHARSKNHQLFLKDDSRQGRPSHIEKHESVHFEIRVKQNHLLPLFLFLPETDRTGIGSIHFRQPQQMPMRASLHVEIKRRSESTLVLAPRSVL